MNLNDSRVKAALEDIENRAMSTAEAYEWATGKLSFIPTSLLPTSASLEERAALERLARMVTSLGPRALTVLKNGTLGDINWGAGGVKLDEAMRLLRLPQLAQRFHLQGRVAGMIAGHVYTPEGSDAPRIQRLGGYLEPLRDPEDMDYEWGIYQAILVKLSLGREHWLVRIYDLETKLVYEWSDLRKPTEIGRVPEPLSGLRMPRYRILHEDADGLPVGEFMTALPVLKSEWASQLRADRVEEATAFAQLLIKGEVKGYERRGATRVILASESGDAKYITPGDLSQIHAHHDRKLERLRQLLNLPGGYLGGQTPSGEALMEAAQDYMSSCDVMATAIGELLTELTADYFEAAGIRGASPNVSISVNRNRVKDQVITQVRDLVKDGLLDRASGIRVISQFFDEIADTRVEAFIQALGLEDKQGSLIPQVPTM